MNLSSYKIFNIYGIKKIELEGEYSPESLTDKLIKEWIPYVECDRKCYRSDYCKYTEPSPYHPDRLTDVQCGVVVNSLKIFIKTSFHILESLPKDRIQYYLDGAFYYSQFILNAEHMIGMCMDQNAIEDYGKYAPAIFGHTTKLRDDLNNLGSVFQHIPEFRSKKGVLFVEGRTEKAFLEKLKDSHSSWFLHLNIEVYNGTGNRRPKRIQMLLDNYQKQGYKVYIQGDADGKDSKIFNELVRKGSVEGNDTFVFKHDFESAVPLDMFLSSLYELELLEKEKNCEYISKVQTTETSIVKVIKTEFDVDLNPYKLEIAEMIAERLNKRMWAWWQDEKFNKSELGQFLTFIQKII